ncbi:glycosyltransferase family 39 protein [Sphingomonas sp. BAUL-RG-20F-R05-02]|uniref:glycosyltransferase family 39 protein n=1 Tax=Sphingomonas sp. BAUL-RG-20F-R05-02 TaxID=2914830 RepID=UPI001F590D0B|nr:hypothetical protein [Sphingomonas sp. BAUL-RG-20F-R05-02]
MTEILTSPAQRLPSRDRGWLTAGVPYWQLIAILFFALAYRAATFGDPILDYDEQLYLTIGDRLLHGHLPYVEMWDRKPPGLFAIYAMIRLMGGTGFVQYQVVAALCAGATAALIYTMSRRSTSVRASLIISVAYLLFLNPLHGAGGQSPVFYNVLTAFEAWLTLKAGDSQRPRMVILYALATMVIAGVAIQCKYTPFVEGVYFGLIFLVRFHRIGIPVRMIIGIGAAMVGLAVLPTLIAMTIYWRLGHLDAFVQANFVSVFARHPFPPERRSQQQMLIATIGGPLLLMAVFKLTRVWRNFGLARSVDFSVLAGWCVAALIGFSMLGDFFDFYFITVLPPLLVFIAPFVDLPGRKRAVIIGFLLVWPFVLSPPRWGLAAQHSEAMATLVGAIRPYIADGRCLYVYDGPTSLYFLTKACVPTRFIYPDHLTNPTETPALGIDPVAEESRLLATRPGAIVFADTPLVPRVDVATRAVLLKVLKRDYIRVSRVTIDRTYDVFALRDLHPGAGLLPGAPINPR